MTGFAAPVVSRCPSACCFNQTCATWIQQGIEKLWISQRITRREDCAFFAHRAQLHLETTGLEAPATASDLLLQLAERRAIQGEGRAA